jgi:hypothetical protein
LYPWYQSVKSQHQQAAAVINSGKNQKAAMQIPKLRGSILIFSLILLPIDILFAADAPPATVNWLDQSAPLASVGVSWGVPWPRGTVQNFRAFSLKTGDGKLLPLQSWPLAYWPDGSMKWTGFATVGGPDVAGPLTIVSIPLGSNTLPAQPGDILKVSQTSDAIEIDTGKLKCRIPKSGPFLIDSMTVDGKEVARHGQLECILQNGPETDHLNLPPREAFVSDVKTVTLEQSGPVRADVKIEGFHKAVAGGSPGQSTSGQAPAREWLPFVVRFYFYAGQTPVRVVHTIVFDGDPDKDFIHGLGIVFDVPMREQQQNRHIRFANSNGGVWAEPLQLAIMGRGARGGGRGLAATEPLAGAATQPTGRGRGFGRGGPDQIEGQRVPDAPRTLESAAWDSFKLVQPDSEGFAITKRTNPKSSWVAVAEGKRAAGLVFIGDVSGGLGVGIKNFWQSYPASLEVTDALSDTARVHAWLWSPDAAGMDLRHYDTHGHGNVNTGGSYEDYEPEFATPVGVGRTSELMLFPTANTPSRVETAKLAAVNSQPPLLTVSPEYMHSTGVFGIWSLPDRSTALKNDVEDRLAGALDYYKKAIDEHHWYGYWNFGDVRHSYDPARHEWRYDIGGYAWDNSELAAPLWIWYSYIRTGRADVYRMAEALIRATSEVDTYHMGRFMGLGSRHNVVHWGDSAKEARVSQSAHARFFYYLSTDERMGDIMRVETNVDEVASKLDPMRKAQPIIEAEKKYPGRVRVGPDWLAFCGNWMTEWERTGDTKWRDKILTGVDSLAAMPYWMRTGQNLTMGYDYNTGKLYALSDKPGDYNLATIQGGAEVAFELTDLLDNPQWTKMWLQYCRLGSAPADVLTKDQTTGAEGADATLTGERGGSRSQGTPRLSAYAYFKTKNTAFAKWAMRGLSAAQVGDFTTRKIEGAAALNPLDEAPGVSTNTTSQSSLQAIEILEMCKDQLPSDPIPPEQQGRGGRGARGARGGAATVPTEPQ